MSLSVWVSSGLFSSPLHPLYLHSASCHIPVHVWYKCKICQTQHTTCVSLRSNPGRFALMTCSPRKVSRFAPLNRYYIIIDEAEFTNIIGPVGPNCQNIIRSGISAS